MGVPLGADPFFSPRVFGNPVDKASPANARIVGSRVVSVTPLAPTVAGPPGGTAWRGLAPVG